MLRCAAAHARAGSTLPGGASTLLNAVQDSRAGQEGSTTT